MSIEQRLRALEQRDPEPPRFVVSAGGVTRDPLTGEAMPTATWRALHPDALSFTLRIDRADRPDLLGAGEPVR